MGTVKELTRVKHPVVFYAESRHYFQYFNNLITGLLASGIPIIYITSDKSDPLLSNAPKGMRVVHIHWMLGHLLNHLHAEVVIMTMPDLGNFLFKRSNNVGHYIYMFHAAVSTHQQYREHAFDNYDVIFATGEYQVSEIRAAEEVRGLREKPMVPYGYPLFDEIATRVNDRGVTDTRQPAILIAPSWFAGCIFDTCLEELMERLAKLPYRILLRSHPEYEKRKKKEFRHITGKIARYSNMEIDRSPNVMDVLAMVDTVITDRSGIAFEFAFGTKRPVIFIETSLKENNPNWRTLGIDPIENSLRKELGVIVDPTKLDQIGVALEELQQMQAPFPSRIDNLFEENFFNPASSFDPGLQYVLGKLKKA